MAKSNSPDYILIGVTTVLLILGILILASVSTPFSLEKFDTPFYFLNRQIFFALIGIILAFLAFKISLSFLKKWAWLLLLINLMLVAMVFLPGIGLRVGGATRWLSLGPISFQPTEFLKITFILYLASWLTSQTKQTIPNIIQQKKWRAQPKKIFSETLFAFFIIIGLIALLLIFQPHISTLGIIISLAVSMYFLAKTPLWHSLLIILITVGGLFAIIRTAPYRLERLLVFLEPGIDPMGMGYQIKQSLIAIGSGGIFGLGLGMSVQRFGFLPQPLADSIFAIFAEETGFIGALILIFLFLMFLWRGFNISKIAGDKFLQLTALGITCWIVIQAFINIGAIIGILPLTGIPLPFISYGGSHLIAELIGIGILLNISKQIS